jgi:hypothetical protein
MSTVAPAATRSLLAPDARLAAKARTGSPRAHPGAGPPPGSYPPSPARNSACAARRHARRQL